MNESDIQLSNVKGASVGEPDYRLACVVCDTKDGLMMFAHRKTRGGPIAGWIMACAEHAHMVTRATMVLGDPVEG